MNKQLTPKEKAKELYSKYENINLIFHIYNNIDNLILHTKQCALIAIDEILNNFGLLTNGKHHFCDYATIRYYEEVKKEIVNL